MANARTEQFWCQKVRVHFPGVGRAKFVVLTAVVGGRWSHPKLCTVFAPVEGEGLLHLWSCLLGCTVAKSFAVSLLDGSKAG